MATASATSNRSHSNAAADAAGSPIRPATAPVELDEATVHQLEDPAVDRLVRPAGLLEDEVREQACEFGVVRAQRGRGQEVSLGQPDKDPPV